ncbi:MAG: RNA-dependent DNA polymerase [Candidatus Altiarchaeota archaeon]|nr:RNA-dependent DNA polymerase [Candidatus Altiarchaeota archaeon]MBU4406407.1 RNA-dependent DNA polymerase [Candidatus Altiarchaeota archaeon]MBU4437577.1 RNA-dependent DNA polymerase [Candidatus Altiarchaeota archaeon]
MKTHDSLYEEIIAFPNMYHAYYEAIKGKADSTFKEFNNDLHQNLWELHEELLNQSYEPSPYTTFYLTDYKTRRIMAPHFRDHIVHHAIYNYLEQVYNSTFIYDSFACQKGKGTHKGFERVKKFINKYNHKDYFMKCDITKYFYSIDHHRLMSIIEKKIKDKNLLWLLGKILNSHKEDPLPSHIINPNCEEQKKGIPIGNLTSQLFANIYLNELDYFVKHKLRVKHYVRYVDDFIILAKDKDYLHNLWQEIHNFLKNQLHLKLEPRKTHINKISFGVDFLGYVAFKKYVRVRSRNYRRFRIRLKNRIHRYYRDEISLESLNASFVSYFGHLTHTNSNEIMEEIEKLYTAVNVPDGTGAGAVQNHE